MTENFRPNIGLSRWSTVCSELKWQHFAGTSVWSGVLKHTHNAFYLRLSHKALKSMPKFSKLPLSVFNIAGIQIAGWSVFFHRYAQR